MRFLIILSFLFLAGCGNPLTRLVPKIEMPEPPKELMTPPKSLKTIIPPVEPSKNVPRT